MSHIPEIRDVPEPDWSDGIGVERFSGRVMSVVSDTVRMPDGAVAVRDYVKHPGAVAVVAVDESDRVLLVRQYRHPVRHMMWELPAGLLDKPGEHPWHAAQRELLEETAFRAADWWTLADVATTPGSSDEACRVFLARGLTPATDFDFVREHEEATMVSAWVPRTELVRLALAGELHNGLLVTGLMTLSVVLGGAGRAGLGGSGGLSGLRPPDAPWPMRPFEGV
jgi:ADP-ribose pyrophosphatase